MTESELKRFLQMAYSSENEACEWKEFKNLRHAVSGDRGNDIISYVSALANMNGGHMVIGVKDKTLEIVGIQDFHDYTPENIRLRILGKCPNLDSERLEIEVLSAEDTGKTVWVFHVPKHKLRLPVYAHDKAWQRIDDNLVEMRPERQAAILAESVEVEDWSAFALAGARLSDLDPVALALARAKFKEKNQNSTFAGEIDSWDIATFLDKAKITIQGQITRAALLLLGKPEASHYLLPHPAQITWKLEAEERDYRHFGPPFLLETTEVLRRIRNIKHKIFPDNQLLATEVSKYDTRVILEALHNCIAHQDYGMNARIIVTEKVDRLIFENSGNFFEGKPEDYFSGERTPRTYRNLWLANAMVNLNMIDTMGHGIHSMIIAQRRRYFPLPDFCTSEMGKVVLEIPGHVIDENYTKLLLERQDLELSKVILLDRVQKRQPITDEAATMLRKAGLIEGRKPNYFVSAKVAEATDTRPTYTLNRGLEKGRLKEFVLQHIGQFGPTSRLQLEELLFSMLPGGLTEEKKRHKVKNLLTEMRAKDKTIFSVKSGQDHLWCLAQDAASGVFNKKGG
ncbi:RNA-binding domain-containing protein [Geoalkalibacter halelectricus]|uniref:DNA binding domain-containing protein n=1 Tax=Geoalkalibacter halelectricus TaxID=2847045 RepID=A0ABY5ZN29_9BACT|nr:RNA-binding domain-containing protein [Geoalkalibacter halelectricus]MDO3378545.1 putative DNA binding domain-containing protein [Geoalkalibacter halelectricus]UWZ80141.1 putative DNA binding domain-containing protein [Geoalkalibacter halelectricus]